MSFWLDIRQGRKDRAEELANAAYEEAYNRIEAQLIADNIADGADESYRPSGAMVHQLVEREMKARKK